MSNHSEMVCTKCNGEGLVEHPMWKAYLADLSAGKFPKPVQHYIYCDQCCGYGHYATQVIADQLQATAPNPALKEVDQTRSDGWLYDHAGFTQAVDHILPTPAEYEITRFVTTPNPERVGLLGIRYQPLKLVGFTGYFVKERTSQYTYIMEQGELDEDRLSGRIVCFLRDVVSPDTDPTAIRS